VELAGASRKAALVGVAAAALAASSVRQASAAARARWTVVTILSGRYTEMQERFERTGASEDVNVLVLHADGTKVRAYRSLVDPDPSHPPGECCAQPGPGCCGSEPTEPSSIGIDGASIDASAVGRFLAFAMDAYPADHYLLSLRGHWAGTRVLPSVGSDGGRGVSILELASLLRDFSARRGGSRLEVLNFGLCMGANPEWLYPLAPLVDYVVAAANWTNAPVSVRWRNFRWARELIKTPSLSGRDLALRMVDVFAENSDGCAASRVGCSNAAAGEPWVAAALDMSRYPAFVDAMTDLSCALIADHRDDLVAEARDASVCYGSSSPVCAGSAGMRDVQHFGQSLRARTTDPRWTSAIDRLAGANGALVMQRVFEPGQYGGQSYGMGMLFTSAGADPAEVGEFQRDTNWSVAIDRLNDAAGASTFDLQVSRAPSAITVGEQRRLVATISSRAGGPGCPVPATWTVEGAAVEVVTGPDDGATTLVALEPGDAVVTASFDGQSSSFALQVTGRPGARAKADAPSDEGCACAAAGGAHALELHGTGLGAGLGLLWCLRRRRLPRRR